MASFLPSSSSLLLLLLFLFANALPSSGGGLVSKNTSVVEITDPREDPVIVALAQFGLDKVNADRQQRWQKRQKMVGKRELPLPQLKFESLQGAQMEFTVWGYPSSVIFAVGSNLENLEVTLDVKPGEFILRTWLLHPSNSK